MFDRLEDLIIRYEELMSELQEPDVANDPARSLLHFPLQPAMLLQKYPHP